MCSARAQSPKQWLVPGAGCPPLGYYGPSAVYRSSTTQPCSHAKPVSAEPCGTGESVHCGPKPLRFKVGLIAESNILFSPLHAGDRPVREQSLHFSPSTPCRREALLSAPDDQSWVARVKRAMTRLYVSVFGHSPLSPLAVTARFTRAAHLPGRVLVWCNSFSPLSQGGAGVDGGR